MDYIIKYWETEELREQGISDIFGHYNSLKEAVAMAKKIYKQQSFPAIEVQNNKETKTFFHISVDEPDGMFDKKGNI